MKCSRFIKVYKHSQHSCNEETSFYFAIHGLDIKYRKYGKGHDTTGKYGDFNAYELYSDKTAADKVIESLRIDGYKVDYIFTPSP